MTFIFRISRHKVMVNEMGVIGHLVIGHLVIVIQSGMLRTECYLTSVLLLFIQMLTSTAAITVAKNPDKWPEKD